jgi:serine/threonine protein phosphatase PrpC
MSGPKRDDREQGPPVPAPPGPASLTDAVVAALAQVGEGDAPKEVPAPEPAAAPGASPTPPEGPITQTMGSAPATPPTLATETQPLGSAIAEAVAPPTVPGVASPAPNGFRHGPGSFADLVERWNDPRASAPAAAPAARPSAPTPVPAAAPAVGFGGPAATPQDDAIQVRYFGRTNVGQVREHNEDNFLVADLDHGLKGSGASDGYENGAGDSVAAAGVGTRGVILSVCDGMGGAAAGEVASQMAVDTIWEVFSASDPTADRDDFARQVVHAIEEAGNRIFSAAKMDRTRRGMGTTSTLAALKDEILFVGQVGDSRAYLLRNDALTQITKDQSLVNQLIEAGQLTEEEAEQFEHSNIILQALGTTEDVTVDLTFLELRKGDRLLLCSDGLSGLVSAEAMHVVLRDTPDPIEASDKLIQMANTAGGHDNITVIIADFDGEGLQAPGHSKVIYQQYPLPEATTRRAAEVAQRTPSIKEGGLKPGADVKRSDSLPAPAAPVKPTGSGVNMGVLVLLVLGVVLILGAGAAFLLFNGMSGSPGPDPVVGVPEEPTPDPVPAPDPSLAPAPPLPPPAAPEPTPVPTTVEVSVTGDLGVPSFELRVTSRTNGEVMNVPLRAGGPVSLPLDGYPLRLEAYDGERLRGAAELVVPPAAGTPVELLPVIPQPIALAPELSEGDGAYTLRIRPAGSDWEEMPYEGQVTAPGDPAVYPVEMQLRDGRRTHATLRLTEPPEADASLRWRIVPQRRTPRGGGGGGGGGGGATPDNPF